MKYQHLFTADAHCLRCSRCLRCLRCTGPYAWFRDKEPIEGVRVYDRRCAGGKKKCYASRFLLSHFCFWTSWFLVSAFLHRCFFAFLFSSFPALQGPCYTRTLLHEEAGTNKRFCTNPFTLRLRYTQTL